LVIGFSACFFHADPQRPIFKGKTLLYLEQSAVNWVAEEDVLTFLIPPPTHKGLGLNHIVQHLDGLVLQGGSDVSPRNYGEEPLRPEWAGDYVRDQYEIALVRAFLAERKPILGICRGAQLMNVAFGGTLYQDIQTQVPKSKVHRDWNIYDQNFHEVRFEAGSWLEKVHGGQKGGMVNTVHHQAVKDVGRDLKVEARCPDDGIIEAIRYVGESFAFAFQWHPEFQDPKDSRLLDGKPVLREFLTAAERRRNHA
jgi:putative glutamine amidotransferase